ncbi:MAG: hypothetical protein LBE82_09630, partial [Chitinophagaceae bacterium]|nr:hypothetical protein [Chitinophagaceae bacterium]
FGKRARAGYFFEFSHVIPETSIPSFPKRLYRHSREGGNLIKMPDIFSQKFASSQNGNLTSPLNIPCENAMWESVCGYSRLRGNDDKDVHFY